MSSYKKFTLSTFKQKLVDGDYENATGANRAIGKTQELSDAEKVKAKTMVAAHFGTEPAKAKPAKKASKSAKKVGKVKVAKAPAKKAKVKPAKRAPTKPAPAVKTVKKAAKRGKKKASSKRKAVVAAPAADPAPAATKPTIAKARPSRVAREVAATAPVTGVNTIVDTSREAKIQLMGQIITHVDVILRSMELSKKLYPKGDVEQGVKSAQTIMSRAVSELEKAVTFDTGTAASTPAVTPTAKTSTKKGKRATKAPTAAVEAAGTEEPDGNEEPAGGALDLNDPSLTEEEREEIRLARSVRPAVDRRFGTATA